MTRGKLIDKIKNLLINRARNNGIVEYREIFKIFEDDEDHKQDMWNIFEEACEQIPHNSVHINEEAIYGALMSNKYGVPGDGFFDIFQHKRIDEYARITGDQCKNIICLSDDEKKSITDVERQKVYAHSQAI